MNCMRCNHALYQHQAGELRCLAGRSWSPTGCDCPGYIAPFPVLPYAGTSGWSGSDTSRERAESRDAGGATRRTQGRVLDAVRAEGCFGATWTELSAAGLGHHGVVSGALSALHKGHLIDRLTIKRDRCAVYVSPEHVDGRATAAQGRRT